MRPHVLLSLALALLLATAPVAASGIAPENLATTARALAGLDAEGSDALAEHAAELDAAWTQLEERHFEPMRTWADSSLRPRLPDGPAPLFYPFGGPDLLSAFVLYPDATSWTLIGLEPPGSVADPRRLADAELAEELSRLRGALAPIVNAGYFVKKWMEADLDSQAFRGVLPILLVFIARADLEPLGVEAVAVTADGRLERADSGDGLRLRVRGPGKEVRDIVYLRQNLADDALAEAPGFVAWLDRLAPTDTWIKAGHYLLHEPGFTTLRELLFASSRSLLQDDSAVPWRHFDPERWSLTLFGEYDAVLPVYRDYFQPDLAAEYTARPDTEPLPFQVGYHALLGGGPLILAVPKSTKTGD